MSTSKICQMILRNQQIKDPKEYQLKLKRNIERKLQKDGNRKNMYVKNVGKLIKMVIGFYIIKNVKYFYECNLYDFVMF